MNWVIPLLGLSCGVNGLVLAVLWVRFHAQGQSVTLPPLEDARAVSELAADIRAVQEAEAARYARLERREDEVEDRMIGLRAVASSLSERVAALEYAAQLWESQSRGF